MRSVFRCDPARGSDGRSRAVRGAVGARAAFRAARAAGAALPGAPPLPLPRLRRYVRKWKRSGSPSRVLVNLVTPDQSEVRELRLLEPLDLSTTVVSGLGDLCRGRSSEGSGAGTPGPPSPGGTGLITVLLALERHLGRVTYTFASERPPGPLAASVGRPP